LACTASVTDDAISADASSVVSSDDVAALSSTLTAFNAASTLLQAADASNSTSLIAPPTALIARPFSPNDIEASSVRFTIGSWNTPSDFPTTPQALFDDPDFQINHNTARYPASGYIEDFYGVEGYRAYIEIEESDDGWGVYRVNLYVYQTLSTSIEYTLEQYRVPADDWTSLIDRTTGVYNPIAFENIETKYFDNSTETRTLQWNRYVDGNVYVTSYFDMPADFDDAAYDYSDTVVTPTTQAAVGNEYASHQTIVTDNPNHNCDSDPNGFCVEFEGVEFYDEVTDADGDINSYSKSIIHADAQDGATRSTAINGVIIYRIDGNGDKTTRSKSEMHHVKNSLTRDREITEEIIVDDSDADGLKNYQSTSTTITLADHINDRNDSFTTSQTVLNVEETSTDDSNYSGTMTTTIDGSVTTWDATLDFERGLRLTKKRTSSNVVLAEITEGEPDIQCEFGTLDHFSDQESEPTCAVALDNGTFVGSILNGYIEGIFTNVDGIEYDARIGGGEVVIDE